MGVVNFLSDKSQTPHMKAMDLYKLFDVSPTTGSAKSKWVRDTLDAQRLSPDWTLPSRMDAWTLVWMLSVNGSRVDVRPRPLAVQQIAYDKGLIPYIPALKQSAGSRGGQDGQ